MTRKLTYKCEGESLRETFIKILEHKYIRAHFNECCQLKAFPRLLSLQYLATITTNFNKFR